MTLHLMEPELEELLLTIAADPRSSLLRVDRPTILRGYFDRDPMVRESCTQLTSAERQLLRVHRRELAGYLRSACFDKLGAESQLELNYCMNHGVRPFPPQPGAQWAIEQARTASSKDPSAKRRTAVQNATASSNPLALAIAACRILPNTAAYLLLSDAYQVLGEASHDLMALECANRLARSVTDQAHVQSYLAFHRTLHGSHLSAIDCYQNAHQLERSWPNEILSCLLLSARCAELRSFEDAAQELANEPLSAAALKDWTHSQRLRRDQGFWSASREAMSFVAKHKVNQSEQVLYVLEELFAHNC